MEKMLSKMEKTNKQLLAKLKAVEKGSKKAVEKGSKKKPKPSKKTPVESDDENAQSATQLVPDSENASESAAADEPVERLAEQIRHLQDAINEGNDPVLFNVIARQDRQLLNQFTISNLKNMASTIRCSVPSKISKKAEVIDYILSVDMQAPGGRKRTRSTTEL